MNPTRDGQPPESTEDIVALIGKIFQDLPPELRKAARYVAENPSEVAFRSMRNMAKGAQVHPSTMVRLARALGLPGYPELRAVFQARVGQEAEPFLTRARDIRVSPSGKRWMQSIQKLVDEEAASIDACIRNLKEEDIEESARLFRAARRIFVMGLRGMFPAAYLLHYSSSMFSDKTALVDGSAGTHLDALHGLGANDVVVLFTCHPYPRDVLRAIRFFRQRKAALIAVTDGSYSPAAADAAVVFEVRPTRTDLLSSAVANVLVSRLLSTVLLSVSARSSTPVLKDTDERFAAFDVYARQ